MSISYKRLGIVLLVALFSVLAVVYITPLVYPFILGWLIALLINPLADGLYRRFRIPRWAGVSLSLLLFVSLFIGIITLIVTQVTIELIQLSVKLPEYVSRLVHYFYTLFPQEQIDRYIELYQEWWGSLNDETRRQIDLKKGDWLNTLTITLRNLITGFLNFVIALLTSLPNLATVLVIAVLAAFFISKDYEGILQWFRRWVPAKVRESMGAVWKDLKKALFGFIKAQVLLISITALIVTLGLIILRVDYAISIGLLTGLADLLPYLGTGTVFIPWILYLFFTEQYQLVIGLSILYGVIVVVRQIMEPKILAETIGLNPLLTLIALFVGLKLFGFLGLIIGPVTLVILQALIRANVFRDLWRYIQA